QNSGCDGSQKCSGFDFRFGIIDKYGRNYGSFSLSEMAQNICRSDNIKKMNNVIFLIIKLFCSQPNIYFYSKISQCFCCFENLNCISSRRFIKCSTSYEKNNHIMFYSLKYRSFTSGGKSFIILVFKS